MKKATEFLFRRFWQALVLLLAASALTACLSGSGSWSTTFLTVVPSPALVIAPRVAASTDSSSWLAWIEGDNNSQAPVAARVNSVGSVIRWSIGEPIAGALRDQQILVSGTTPGVAWREYASTGPVRVRAVALRNGRWITELSEEASYLGEVTLVPTAFGGASLMWLQGDAPGQTRLVSMQRAAGGGWSPLQVIRTAEFSPRSGGPRQSSQGNGSLMALWEEPSASGGDPALGGTLWSSIYDPARGSWEPPLKVYEGPVLAPLDVAAAGDGAWVAVWCGGDASRRTALLAKRFFGGQWESVPSRVDRGQDARLGEISLSGNDARVSVAWTGLADLVSAPNTVRAADFDSGNGTWSMPALLRSAQFGFPTGLRLRVTEAGTAAAVWSISQGPDGPSISSSDANRTWSAASSLSLQGDGNAVDLAFFAPDDVVTTWYRLAAQNRVDIVVHRLVP
jgi:hypothetical protein